MDYLRPKNGQLFIECTKKILTKENLLNFIEEINKRQQSVFKTKFKEVAEVENENLAFCFKILEKEKIVFESPEKESVFLEELKKYLLGLPLISLQIALLPSDKFLEKISLWLEEELKQKIILDINVNPKIVGGAMIECQGKYLNLSLEKEIDRLIPSKKYEGF